MRFPDDHRRRFARGLSILAVAGMVPACGTLGDNGAVRTTAALPANGPQADYPVLVGEPYVIEDVSFTPADVLNYDEVGYLAVDGDAPGITGAHHTLPVPSYAEVTSLETGRTILVRLERRGPMQSTHLVALSPAAMEQLQAEADTPVRVRRVNPPEAQRLPLRAGQSVAPRMDTPMSLVAVLRRKLAEPPVAGMTAEAVPAEAPELAASVAPLPPLVPIEEAAEPADSFQSAFAPESGAVAPAPTADPQPELAAAEGGFVVQAAAFSTEDRARSAATALGGKVSPGGSYFRVRTGPFATREEAEASLAIVQAAGYSDARILTNG